MRNRGRKRESWGRRENWVSSVLVLCKARFIPKPMPAMWSGTSILLCVEFMAAGYSGCCWHGGVSV